MGKLVRDKHPEMCQDAHLEGGSELEYRTLSKSELCRALLEKLKEECQEVIDSEGRDIRELGDVFTVLCGIQRHIHPHTPYPFTSYHLDKLARSGGFDKGVYLVTEPTERDRQLWQEQLKRAGGMNCERKWVIGIDWAAEGGEESSTHPGGPPGGGDLRSSDPR